MVTNYLLTRTKVMVSVSSEPRVCNDIDFDCGIPENIRNDRIAVVVDPAL